MRCRCPFLLQFHVHLRVHLRAILLLQAIEHVRHAADSAVLRLLLPGVLRVLSDVEHGRFRCIPQIYKIHIC